MLCQPFVKKKEEILDADKKYLACFRSLVLICPDNLTYLNCLRDLVVNYLDSKHYEKEL